jgi:hypothetical protein
MIKHVVLYLFLVIWKGITRIYPTQQFRLTGLYKKGIR